MLGTFPSSLLTPARIAFSTPFVNAFIHPTVAGPVLASHALDLQDFGTATLPAPVGPPSINVEAKLVGVNDDSVENGGDPEGILQVRGPSVGKLLGGPDGYVNVPSASEEEEGWVRTGARAVVQTNGSFRIL